MIYLSNRLGFVLTRVVQKVLTMTQKDEVPMTLCLKLWTAALKQVNSSFNVSDSCRITKKKKKKKAAQLAHQREPE